MNTKISREYARSSRDNTIYYKVLVHSGMSAINVELKKLALALE